MLPFVGVMYTHFPNKWMMIDMNLVIWKFECNMWVDFWTLVLKLQCPTFNIVVMVGVVSFSMFAFIFSLYFNHLGLPGAFCFQIYEVDLFSFCHNPRSTSTLRKKKFKKSFHFLELEFLCLLWSITIHIVACHGNDNFNALVS